MKAKSIDEIMTKKIKIKIVSDYYFFILKTNISSIFYSILGGQIRCDKNAFQPLLRPR